MMIVKGGMSRAMSYGFGLRVSRVSRVIQLQIRMAHSLSPDDVHFDSNWPVDNRPKSPYSLFKLDEKTFNKAMLKKRYHELALMYHPDHSHNKTILRKDNGLELTSMTIHENVLTNEDKLDRFKVVKEAYELLADPKRKNQYDKFGSGWVYGPTIMTSQIPRYETHVQYYNAGTWEDYSDLNKDKEHISVLSLVIWLVGLVALVEVTSLLSRLEETVNKKTFTQEETERDLSLAYLNYGLDDDKWSRLRRFLWFRTFGLYRSKGDLDREAERNENMIQGLMSK